jgi:hypothetical protein
MYRIILFSLLAIVCLQPARAGQARSILDVFYSRHFHFISYDSVQTHAAAPLDKHISIEDIPTLILKYAILLDTTVETVTNYKLYEFIDQWMGVKYQYGGNELTGIDCSSFSGRLFRDLYDINLPRTSSDQYLYASPIEDEEISEGDLIFFKTSGKFISHVGVYLGNRKFVHASTTKGVTIDDLNFSYYKKTFVGAGRPVKL